MLVIKKFLQKLFGERKGSQTFETIIIAVLVAALAIGAVGIIGDKVRDDATNNVNTLSTKTSTLMNTLSQ